VALSAHQTEGHPVDSDWWRAARAGRVPDPGPALDFWERFPEDMATARALGLDAFRFSVEWARVEPQEGRFDGEALARYRAMAVRARALGLWPVVTLHHFTLPGWLADRGGVLAPDSAAAFARYAGRVVEALPEADLFLTVNEPMVLAVQGYLFGVWPPFCKDARLFLRAAARLAEWHRRAWRAVKAVRPEVRLGLAKHFLWFRPASPLAEPAVRLADRLFHEGFLRRVGPLDVIGVNYYTETRLDALGRPRPAVAAETEMGWTVAPEGLRHAVRRLGRFAPVILITENGVATLDEDLRRRFIARHLAVVAELRREGWPIEGYFYWTLYDNYEWAEGYERHFGLGDRERRLRATAPLLPALWQEANGR
jgi:beta-glucosidase